MSGNFPRIEVKFIEKGQPQIIRLNTTSKEYYEKMISELKELIEKTESNKIRDKLLLNLSELIEEYKIIYPS